MEEQSATGLRRGAAAEAGLSGSLCPGLDAVLERFFARGSESLAPWSVALVARRGTVAYERALGEALPGTVFDLASVTKAVATAPLLMLLVEQGVLGLDRPVVELVPEWIGRSFETVTLRDLLVHRAGLWEWRPVYFHATEPRPAIEFVLGLEPRYPPRTVYAYSDLGLMVAGEVLRRATAKDVARLTHEWLAHPLRLMRTAFRPPADWRSEIAPGSTGDGYERRMVETGQPYPVPERVDEYAGWRKHVLMGEANDGNSFHAFGGGAGHAGLFGTARDLAVLGTALSRADLASRAVLDSFTEERHDAGQAAVFRVRSLAGERAFWHPGFTGTRWLVCPGHDLVVVLLSNRLHVEGEPQPVDAAWEAMLGAVEAALVGG